MTKCKYHCCENEVEVKSQKIKVFCSPVCKNKYHVDKKRWDTKLKALNYKGGKCIKCGYNQCPSALEFHHLEPENKEFSLSKTPHTRSWERTKAEIDKCDLLCANCHREKEFIKNSIHKEFLVNLAVKYNFNVDFLGSKH